MKVNAITIYFVFKWYLAEYEKTVLNFKVYFFIYNYLFSICYICKLKYHNMDTVSEPYSLPLFMKLYLLEKVWY